MAEARPGLGWAWYGLFVGLGLGSIFLRIVPLPQMSGQLPGPDLLMCLSCLWVLRRPDLLPAALIVGVVLLEDILLMRPPGLWAAIMLVGTEFLRRRAALSRELTLLSEWMLVALVMLAMVMAHRMVNVLAMLPQPPLGLSLVQFGASVLAWPLLVGVMRVVFGLRKPATGEVDAFGRRV